MTVIHVSNLCLASLVAQRLKHLLPMWDTWVRSLGREDPLEKEMAIHSSILAWRISWMEKPTRLQSTGSQRVGHDWATELKWRWSSNTLATWCEELTLKKRPLCWERLKAGEGGDRGWDGWMASLTQWRWAWANLGDSEGQGSLACREREWYDLVTKQPPQRTNCFKRKSW